ncbi:MAG: homoserine dehydrogenase, partial [Candidatus Bathyarchaeia archaeon]
MRLILIGCGVVGQNLMKILANRKVELAKNYGFRPRLVAIVDRGGAAINPKGLDLEKFLFLRSNKGTVAADSEYGHPKMPALDVIESVEAETVVEVTSTNVKDGEPGLSHIKSAFRTGKHVVT